MRAHVLFGHIALCVAIAIAGTAVAATPSPQSGSSDSPTHHGAMNGGGMMGGGMMGGDMMGMMRSCQSMMGSRPGTSAIGLPQLPAGNEKLETQMHAEMLQKLGEIQARYAERIKEGR